MQLFCLQKDLLEPFLFAKLCESVSTYGKVRGNLLARDWTNVQSDMDMDAISIAGGV
jgi:hypothetical protein